MHYEGAYILSKDGEKDKKLKHGAGVLRWQDGREYRGQFALDKMHGQGIMSWPTGAKYVGQYCDNSKGGLGKVTLPDGSSFEGNWYKGMRHGEILYVDPDGAAFRMEYESDQVVGTESVDSSKGWTLKPGYDVFIKRDDQEGPDQNDADNPSCCICLGDLCKGEQCCRMPCGHEFHKECIDNWTTRKNQCPLCMQKIPLHKLVKVDDVNDDETIFNRPRVSIPNSSRP